MGRDLREDLRICDSAADGPWNVIGGCGDDAPSHFCRHVGPVGYPVLWAYGGNRVANVAFVSAARVGLPEALRALLRVAEVFACEPTLEAIIDEAVAADFSREQLRDQRDEAEATLRRIRSACGLPDAGDACREVLRLAKEVLGDDA